MAAKIGRPTNNPKEERVTVRLDQESIEILNNYCQKTGEKRAEALRKGIKGLKNK